jgi:hypothetical protein
VNASRWRWHRKSDGAPVTCVQVNHLLTRGDIAELLCDGSVPTGTQLGNRALLEDVRLHLRAAGVLEPFETWAANYSEEEAGARRKWADEQAAAFYARTGGQ